MKKKINRSDYSIVWDEESGQIQGLYDRFEPEQNWLAEGGRFAVPFLHGTQFGEDHQGIALFQDGNGLYGQSPSGLTRIRISPDDSILRLELQCPADNGPRIGMSMDLNFLDMPGHGTWEHQCMPKVIYTDESLAYAYFVFGTADGRYLILTVSSAFAAWRLRYSYEGHRIIGFQLLTQADDIRTDGRGELPAVTRLAVQIQFAKSMEECIKKTASALGIAIAVPAKSGGLPQETIPLRLEGNGHSLRIVSPDGDAYAAAADRLLLQKPGIYRVITVTQDGREHTTRLLCHEELEKQMDRVNGFYQKYFQHPSGAFYRAISTDTLRPDKDVIGGGAFGDPNEHYSCRTGEFGGFSAWAMMKNLLIYGAKPHLRQAVDRYVLDWALNRGHEKTPYLGSLCKHPHSYLGRDFGPYHVYEEYNYMQQEIFLLEELADYYALTQDDAVKQDALCLARHIQQEHLDERGRIINQNFPSEPGTDYSTVHIPVLSFLRWAHRLEPNDPDNAAFMADIARKIADHVWKRGLDFPTEGEPCTEDGSMACAAATLLYAYRFLEAKPEYLRTAKELLEKHRMLELDGTDCRMKGSTVRFWETQYETRDWGPSINAGHGWTIWTSEAKAQLACIEGDFSALLESYEGFVTNMCKMHESGGLYCCYTPDMIPGLPHAYCPEGMTDPGLSETDLRPTTTHLGMRFPNGAFAASGNYYLIRAAEIWDHISGLDLENGVAVNGVYADGDFVSAAPRFSCLLLRGNGSIRITMQEIRELEVLWDRAFEIKGGTIVRREGKKWVCVPNGRELILIGR